MNYSKVGIVLGIEQDYAILELQILQQLYALNMALSESYSEGVHRTIWCTTPAVLGVEGYGESAKDVQSQMSKGKRRGACPTPQALAIRRPLL